MSSTYQAVSKFFDLEADVEGSEGETEEEDDEQNDFVVANDVVDDENPSHTHWLHWDELNQWEDQQSPEFLAKLAEDIKRRYSTEDTNHIASDINHNDHPIAPFATIEDYIYSVKVKVGLERDIVLTVLQKVLDSPATPDVLSIFCRDAIKGRVYIESKSISAIENILDGVFGVIRSKGAYVTSLVDVQDRHLLLNMSVVGVSQPIKANSWARIKSGKYRGDLALIIDVDCRNSLCSTLIVPRINMDKKRKRGFRIPQCPFNPETVKATFGDPAVESLGPQAWGFKSQFYEFGCLHQNFHITSLSIEGVNATPQELDPFHQCGEHWERAATLISPIKVGDRVRIVSGVFIGIVGEIVEVSAMTVRVRGGKGQDHLGNVQSYGDDAWECLTQDVRRVFEVGDFVQVIHGSDRGLEGFLVHLEGDLATIYTSHSKDENVHEAGRALISKIVDIEWKSNARNFHESTTTVDSFSTRSRYDPEHPFGLPYVAPDPSLGLGKRIVNRYQHMEVLILKGDAKRHFGIITGTHKSQSGEDLMEVKTSTRTINTVNTYHVKDLQERFTKMPIDKACWIPARFRNTKAFQTNRLEDRPSTPLPSPGGSAVHSPAHISMGAGTPCVDPDTEVSTAGEWLLDRRLIFKKLDVRVRGTTSSYPHWQSGMYEGQLGWVVLINKVQSLQESTPVKIGFTENRALLQMRHLVPEHTTEVPTYFPTNTVPTSVLSNPGSRVVVIGPDLANSSDFIGDYALVIQCSSPSPLPLNCGLIQIASPGPNWGKYTYVDISSVCRSIPTPAPINWFGTIIH